MPGRVTLSLGMFEAYVSVCVVVYFARAVLKTVGGQCLQDVGMTEFPVAQFTPLVSLVQHSTPACCAASDDFVL